MTVGGADQRRDILRDEILRWNKRVNLVSRQDTRRQLDRLITQCESGWRLVSSCLTGEDLGRWCYADLGSGNGLPGLLWAGHLADAGARGPTWLVEPRQRRAWFLERTARKMSLADATVQPRRWGADLARELASTGSSILISLKALRLTEPVVLEGIRDLASGGARGAQSVIVARFLGPDAACDGDLARDLQITTPHGCWTSEVPRIVEGVGARVLVTVHRTP